MALPHRRFRDSPIPLPPAEASKEFQNLIEPIPVDDAQGFAENEFVGIPKEANEKPRNRRTLTSFGDKGTTASINSYGQIIQISRFLGVGTSGFFCAQPWRIAIPNLFGYSPNSWDLVTYRDQPIGLQLPLRLLPQKPPTVRFLHNRWPRLDYQTKHYRASLQYSCHNGTVAQTYVFKPLEKSSFIPPEHFATVRLGFEHQFIVHDLVPMATESVPKNQPGENQTMAFGPHNYGLIRIMNGPSNGSGDAEAVQRVTSVATQRDDANSIPQVGLLMSPFVNGTPRKVLQRQDGSGRYDIDFTPEHATALNCIEITILYRMQHLQQPKTWERDMLSIKDLSRIRDALRQTCFTPIRYSFQPHLNFIISRNLEHVLSVCSVPVTNIQELAGENVTIEDEEIGQAPGSNRTSEKDTSRQNRAHGGSEPPKAMTDSDNGETSGKESSETSTRSRGRAHNEFRHGASAATNSEFRDGNGTRVRGELVLTCGDLHGHTIDTQSSFFAFKFLLSVLAFLEEERKAPASLHEHVCISGQGADECSVCRSIVQYCDRLCERIRCTCMCHLEWVANVGHKMSEPFPFVAKNTVSQLIRHEIVIRLTQNGKSPFKYFFSASGGIPKSWDSQGNSNNEFVLEAPYHILKFGESPLLSEIDLHSGLFAKLASFVKFWLRALKQADKRNSRAVPRSADGGVNNFRLADHAWIWCALRCVEQLQSWMKPYRLGCVGEWTAKEFQMNILKRFTTVSPYSEQSSPKGKAEPKSRMLAVARSSLENRFLFHSKDTSLFYAMDSRPSFFSATELDRTIDVWIATVQSQQDHEENDDSSWTKTLRYTLAIIMSQKRLCINHRSSRDMFATAMNILLQSTSPNGLFPVFLSLNKDPIHKIDQRRSSSHLQALFEVPYILFTYGQRDPGNGKNPEFQKPSNAISGGSRISSVVPNMDSGKDEETTHRHQELNSMRKTNLKKRAPFNNLVDQTSIVDIEEEWLYKYPDFLDSVPKYPTNLRPSIYGPDTGFSFVIDIPKSKWMSQSATTLPLPTTGQVLESLMHGGISALVGMFRTTETAKRRFVMLCRIDGEMREMSIRMSPPQESDNMVSFIERHMTFEKYFLDNTTAALNRWETELHLSYYLLFDSPKDPQTRKDESGVQFPGISKKIRQESLSFRLVGDFFNRYWTCHFVKDNQVFQEADTKLVELLAPRHTISESKRAKEPWRQRKVLELLLFDHMLEEIIAGTSDIILEIKQQVLGEYEAHRIVQRRSRNLGPEDEADSSALSDAVSLCKTNSIAYFAINKQWQVFQRILEVVEDEITENLEKVSEWNQREKKRYLEKPRWTRKNEREYRETISKLLDSNQRKIFRLHRCRTNVQTLKSSLESRLQYMRDDLNAYFTTVTVIFLPLGFAAGIFSMNGLPGSTVWHGMAYTSAVALGITVLILVNAQTVAVAITASWNYAIRLPITLLWHQLRILAQVRKPTQHNVARGIRQECDRNSSNDTQVAGYGGRQSIGVALGERQQTSSSSAV